MLATLLRHMWKVTKQRLRLHIRWIRGHSGDVGSGIADRLADVGARLEVQHRWGRRCPLSGGWDEEGFITKVVSIQRKTTVCEEVLEAGWTGPTAFPRTDTASHKLVRALGTLTTAIAYSAIAWGAVKRGRAGLGRHDLVWMEVRRLGVERRGEKDPLKRKKSVHRTVQSSTADATKTDRPQLQEVAITHRLPTRAPILEKLGPDGTTERVEDLQCRTDIVHKHFKELFTDPLHKETPEWTWQRRLYEVLQSPEGKGGRVCLQEAHIVCGRPFGD